MLPTVQEAAKELRNGRTSVAELLDGALARARTSAAEAVFTRRDEAASRAQAAAAERLLKSGSAPSPLTGLPVSIKDLFDVEGEVTTAGSRVLAAAPPAAEDSEVVKRLRSAGAVLVGRTNMTEFAFSGLGLNPHFGTPANPFAPTEARIPGGSSSGAAVSVAQGMAIAAIGTDTGGSVRIPAALCGLVGFKPTASRISTRGVLPLSPTLDSVGPIARTVRCCAEVDAVLAGEAMSVMETLDPRSLRLALPETLVWEDAHTEVQRSCERAIERLARAGAQIIRCEVPAFREIVAVNASGGFPAAEAWLWHESLLQRCAHEYDPRVRTRIERGAGISARHLIQLVRARRALRARVASELPDVDAWLMPTVPKRAPRIAELEADAAYFEMNRLMLRNPSLVNFLDGCAVSLPCHEPGAAPVGLSLVGAGAQDRRLLAIAHALEPIVGLRAQ